MNITICGPLSSKKEGISRVTEKFIDEFSVIDNTDHLYFMSFAPVPSVEILFYGKNRKIHIYDRLRLFKNIHDIAKLIKYINKSDVLIITDNFGAASYFVIYLYYALIGRFVKKVKIIQFSYDFIFYKYKDSSLAKLRLFNTLFGWFFKKIPFRYIAISFCTKKDLIKYWNIPEGRIRMAHLASFIPAKIPRKNFGSKKIIYVGGLAYNKNIEGLIDSFVLARKDISDAKLLIVGRPRGKEGERLLEYIKKSNVEYLGYQTDEAVEDFYGTADLFVFPSFYEGFGLPVLEAMSCGCPVITSNVSSLPEIAGDAAILVDPCNIEDMAEKITKVLKDDDLKKEMSIKGIERAKEFSWKKFAMNVNDAIKN